MLVVWGLVQDGELRLDPAFVLEGPAELPERPGPYRVEGLGAGGEVRFSLSFTPAPLEFGGASFAYLVPYEPEWAATLDRMVLTGPEGEYTMTRDGEPEMAVLTDPSTGVIRTIARNWDGGPASRRGDRRCDAHQGDSGAPVAIRAGHPPACKERVVHCGTGRGSLGPPQPPGRSPERPARPEPEPC